MKEKYRMICIMSGNKNLSKFRDHLNIIDYFRAYRERVNKVTNPKHPVSDPWVIVFNEHKIVYIPIPKAANSSIRTALLPLVGEKQEFVDKIQEYRGFEKIRLNNFLERHDERWMIFTVVRNPYDRYVSGYSNKLADRDKVFGALLKMGLRAGDSFMRFIRLLQIWPPERLNDHFAPQALILEKALRLKIHVFKMEDLHVEWPKIKDKIEAHAGVKIGELMQLNRSSSSQKKQTFLSSEAKEIIRNIARIDFDAFDYGTDSAH